MKTQTRDDAIARNQQLIRVLKLVVICQSITLILLGSLVCYGFFAKQVMYVPTMSHAAYSQSQIRLSPAYVGSVADDLMQLRLTFNEDTVEARYQKLLSMVEPKSRARVASALNKEISVIKKRKMQSVFYQDSQPLVDMHELSAKVSGNLVRIDDGVILPARHKTWLIHFANHLGTLRILSITEVTKNEEV